MPTRFQARSTYIFRSWFDQFRSGFTHKLTVYWTVTYLIGMATSSLEPRWDPELLDVSPGTRLFAKRDTYATHENSLKRSIAISFCAISVVNLRYITPNTIGKHRQIRHRPNYLRTSFGDSSMFAESPSDVRKSFGHYRRCTENWRC